MYQGCRPMCRSKCNIQPACVGGNWYNQGQNGQNSFVCGQNGGYNGYNPGQYIRPGQVQLLVSTEGRAVTDLSQGGYGGGRCGLGGGRCGQAASPASPVTLPAEIKFDGAAGQDEAEVNPSE